MQAVERIRELLPALPIGDIPYGEKFLNKRKKINAFSHHYINQAITLAFYQLIFSY